MGASQIMTQVQDYRAFGLRFRSEVSMPGLPVVHGTGSMTGRPDVFIRRGCIDDHFAPDERTIRFNDWMSGGDGFVLDVPEVARFLVRDGREIWIDAASDPAIEDIAAYLMGSAFAALLQQRHLLTLHASAIDTPQGAVLFIGRSGAGKSTLLAAMLGRGYAMLTDDICALDPSNPGAPVVVPAFPSLRLMQTSLDALGKTSDGLTALRADKAKFLLPGQPFCDQPRPFHRAFLLVPRARGPIEVFPLSQTDQFETLGQYTFRRNYYKGHGSADFAFQAISALARRDALFRIVRPESGLRINELADLVEDQIG